MELIFVILRLFGEKYVYYWIINYWIIFILNIVRFKKIFITLFLILSRVSYSLLNSIKIFEEKVKNLLLFIKFVNTIYIFLWIVVLG